MISSVLNEGARGLQNSQREMLKSASEISRANIRPEQPPEPELATNEPTTFAPVSEPNESEPSGSLAEPLVELRRQEQVFNASASVVSVASDTLGSLIDIQS